MSQTRNNLKGETMSNPNNILNAIQTKVIEVCNADGINLADTFETVEDFKTWLLSFTIKMVMDVTGFTVKESMDIVCGDGSYNKLAETVWDSLQS